MPASGSIIAIVFIRGAECIKAFAGVRAATTSVLHETSLGILTVCILGSAIWVTQSLVRCATVGEYRYQVVMPTGFSPGGFLKVASRWRFRVNSPCAWRWMSP